NMDMNIRILIKVRLETELGSIRSHPRERGFSGFLHDITNLAGHCQMASAFSDIGFHEQDVASDRRPCQTDDHAGALYTLFHFLFELEFWRAEKFFDHTRRYD